MAKKFLTPIGIVPLTSDPATGSNGQLYFNTVDNMLKVYYDGTWNEISGGGGGGGSVQTDTYLSNSWWLGV